MKLILKALLFVGTIFLIVFGLIWGVTTEFGKETGVYITQDVKLDKAIDSTYNVSTYVWRTGFLGLFDGDNSHIEWSAYATVKCTQVKVTKDNQMTEAKKVQANIRAFLKNNKVCEPD
jgi:hypothetical protein